MALRYGTMAAHTRCRVSVLVMFVVCLRAHVQFWRFDEALPKFSDTATTDHHSDTTIFQLRARWVRISWSIGSEKSFGHVPPVGVESSTPCVNLSSLSHQLARIDDFTTILLHLVLYSAAVTQKCQTHSWVICFILQVLRGIQLEVGHDLIDHFHCIMHLYQNMKRFTCCIKYA